MADAPKVHKNPVTYFAFAVFVSLSESEWTARRVAEMVRRTRELRIKAVNFWELSRYEKSALKANWVAHKRE